MPSDTITITPNGEELVFNEQYHTYRLSGRPCTSVTTFVGKFFPPFNGPVVAKSVAEKKGITVEEVNEAWKYIRVRGTRVHELCEDILNRRDTFRNEPKSPDEKAYFDCAKEQVPKLLAKLKDPHPEMYMADSALGLAGTTDLVAELEKKQPDGTTHLILDWKTNNRLNKEGWCGSMGLECCANVPDSNWWHYALQISTYENILKRNGYYPPDTKFKRIIAHFDYNEENNVAHMVWHETPDLTEIVELMFKSDIWKK